MRKAKSGQIALQFVSKRKLNVQVSGVKSVLKAQLYAADINELLKDDVLFESAINMVSSERAEKTARYVPAQARAQSVGAELLLGAAIADAGCLETVDKKISIAAVNPESKLGIKDTCGSENGTKVIPFQFSYGEHGKPYLKGQNDLFFNLSHSGQWVICAVSPCEVGCDIEKIEPGSRTVKIAKRFFTEDEQTWLRRYEEDEDRYHRAFYRLWTLKESFLKVTGRGLSLPLKDFSITINEGLTEDKHGSRNEAITVIQNLNPDLSYQFREFWDFDGFSCSVCSEKALVDEQVHIFSLSELLGS